MSSAFGSATGNGSKHTTDGTFTGVNEWTGSNVSHTYFPVVGARGGAALYVEHDAVNLFLMYDYLNSPGVGIVEGAANPSFINVFFQIPSDQHDYGVQIGIGLNNFSAFEKEPNVVSPLNADGSLNFNSNVWTPLTDADKQLAQFRTGMTFGTCSQGDPGSPTRHLMAEFQLTINTNRDPKGQPSGIYDPAPAFWSASSKPGGGVDPPMSSGIFNLDLISGGTRVTQVFGANGGPALQPQDVAAVPEPGTIIAASLGLLVGLGAWRRRRAV